MPAATNCKPPHCLIQFPHMDLMHVLVGRGATKRRHGQRNVSFPYEMNSDNGIPNGKGLNCGTSITDAFTKAKMYGCFPSATGRNWMSGTISVGKTSHYHPFISRMSAT